MTRVVAYPFYVPRWEKGKDSKESSNCCVTGCSSTSVVVTTVASTEELLHVLSKRGFTCNGAIRIPTALCKTHYHIVYDDIQSHTKIMWYTTEARQSQTLPTACDHSGSSQRVSSGNLWQ